MGSDVHLTVERLDLDPINVLPTYRNMVHQNQITMFLIVFSRYVIRNDVFYVKGLKKGQNTYKRHT
jgi:hypothetical protein